VTAGERLFVDRRENSPLGKLFDNVTGLQVGQVHMIAADGEAEEWKAWLWPVAGQYPTEHGGNCEAIAKKGDLGKLAAALVKRGQWWA
jgi:hypothetical protein